MKFAKAQISELLRGPLGYLSKKVSVLSTSDMEESFATLVRAFYFGPIISRLYSASFLAQVAGSLKPLLVDAPQYDWFHGVLIAEIYFGYVEGA